MNTIIRFAYDTEFFPTANSYLKLSSCRDLYVDKTGFENGDAERLCEFKRQIEKKFSSKFAWQIHPDGHYLNDLKEPLNFVFQTCIFHDIATLEEMKSIAYFVSMEIGSAFHNKKRDFTCEIIVDDTRSGCYPSYILKFVPYTRIKGIRCRPF